MNLFKKMAETGHWVTRAGRLTNFAEMTDQHIRNALSMARRTPERACWIEPLEAELARRARTIEAETARADAAEALARDAWADAADAEHRANEDRQRADDLGAQCAALRAENTKHREQWLNSFDTDGHKYRRAVTEAEVVGEAMRRAEAERDKLRAENAELRERIEWAFGVEASAPQPAAPEFQAGDLVIPGGWTRASVVVEHSGACVSLRELDGSHGGYVQPDILRRPPLVVGGWVRHACGRPGGIVTDIRDCGVIVREHDRHDGHHYTAEWLIPIAPPEGAGGAA